MNGNPNALPFWQQKSTLAGVLGAVTTAGTVIAQGGLPTGASGWAMFAVAILGSLTSIFTPAAKPAA